MKHSIIMVTALWSACASAAENANNSKYYINFGTVVCKNSYRIASVADETPDGKRKLTEEGCTLLLENTEVDWDGTKAKNSDAIVSLDGRKHVLPTTRLQSYKVQDHRNVKFVTSDIAALCVSSFNPEEAAKAFGDKQWMKSIDCVKAPVGLSVIKIRPDTPSLREPWQVRLKLANGEGLTLWGMPCAFTLPDGTAIRN